jgi:RNA polymerase sigma-70 factor (ECF subfamily)
LFSVARNLFRSQRRWVLLDRERLAEWGLQRTLGVPASPLREIANHELGRHVEQAIATLPLRYREVLLLVSVEGFENEQVCAMLNLKPATLRQRLSRARAMLREAVDFDEER